MQTVPIAITALTGDDLQASGVEGVGGLDAVVPGLSLGMAGPTISPRIRGVGQQLSTGTGNEAPVATYVDGVYIGSSSSSLLEFNNISQVTVLKGPQGTLFGRNTTGGVLQIETRAPQQEFGGEASVEYGNYDTYGADFYVTGGLSDVLAADLAIHYRDQQKGWGKNLANGEDVSLREDFGVRSRWRLDVGPNTQVDFAADYTQVQGSLSVTTPLPGFPDSLPGFPDPSVSDPLFTGGGPYAGGPYDIDADVMPRHKYTHSGGAITLRHVFDGFDLVSITAYRKGRVQITDDFDITAYPSFAVVIDQEERQATQEVRLVSNADGPFSWVLGAFYFRGWAEEGDIQSGPGGATTYAFDLDTSSYAVFGQASYDISSKTSLTAGLRYTVEKRDANGLVAENHLFGHDTYGFSGDLDFERVTWRLALDHQFSDNIFGYVSYNRGFKSGGFNASFSDALDTYKAEVMDAYEVGAKIDAFDRRLRINTAAFLYDYDNVQVFVQDFVGQYSVANGGPTKVWGMDTDFRASITDRLALTGGVSLLHSEFKDDTIAGTRGNSLPNSPKATFNLGVNYQVDLGQAGLVDLNLNYFHSDGWFGNISNSVEQKPYDVINASATWTFGRDDRFVARVWGRNLGDEQYAVGKIDAAISIFAGVPAYQGSMAAPRTYGLTLGVKF